MIIFTSHSSEITSPTPGGTAETEMRNTFGLETTRTEFTPASGVLMEIASIITPNAIAMRLFQLN